MKIQWKDVTSYSKIAKDRTPRTWQTYVAGIRLTVTRHLDYEPDEWIANSYPNLLESQLLESKSVEDAKDEAIKLLVCCCKQVIDAAEKWKPEPRYNTPVNFTSTDNFGSGPEDEDDVYTVEEFIECVLTCSFTDSDGFGYPVKNRMADESIVIVPSKVDQIPKDATHIVWFNQ